jgi:integrase
MSDAPGKGLSVFLVRESRGGGASSTHASFRRSCEAVPLEWRALYAVACFTYLRPGELYELRVRDLDLDMGHVNVSRAWD